MKNNNKGFSLVELIVVVAIMAVLVGVLAPTYIKYVESSKVQKDESAVGEAVQAVKLACANNDIYENLQTCTLTWVSGAQVAISPANAGLLDELVDAKVDTITFTSKTHKNQKYVLNITVDSSTGVVTIADFSDTNFSAE